jgi:hypothetical protein
MARSPARQTLVLYALRHCTDTIATDYDSPNLLSGCRGMGIEAGAGFSLGENRAPFISGNQGEAMKVVHNFVKQPSEGHTCIPTRQIFNRVAPNS